MGVSGRPGDRELLSRRINFLRFALEMPVVAYFLTLECFLQCSTRHHEWGFEKRRMMDPKIALLVLLIAAVVGLSHLSDENLGRMRQQFAGRRWREFMPGRRRA
jgi:hypothetical protein